MTIFTGIIFNFSFHILAQAIPNGEATTMQPSAYPAIPYSGVGKLKPSKIGILLKLNKWQLFFMVQRVD